MSEKKEQPHLQIVPGETEQFPKYSRLVIDEATNFLRDYLSGNNPDPAKYVNSHLPLDKEETSQAIHIFKLIKENFPDPCGTQNSTDTSIHQPDAYPGWDDAYFPNQNSTGVIDDDPVGP